MEEGTKTKKTVFIGGIGDDVDESVLLDTFSSFGDVIEVQIPPAQVNQHQPSEGKHRGFAFVTYTSAEDAQDAIDNMDLNELRGRVLKVSLARPMKTPAQLGGNRAVWESEEWIKQYAKPLSQSGGENRPPICGMNRKDGARKLTLLRSGVQARGKSGTPQPSGEGDEDATMDE
ncbi:RNA-binding domain-containing protein [Punctularia strigosozonata HHB-11173 SS5]|uniref:RNA-binding domain-containing protein n=1 Tax=Punctularia strigosozonata (strain HHB-11173) TaxID=741275 RepID=UPI0004416728|nr:RNA-binding domain-containing protein [Punctularia strigosozonata HHB-11173 SS5]EIN07342.1 RNA-binding domain-containing protein [Punctularia strigosozonata HHB-11173 SS5]